MRSGKPIFPVSHANTIKFSTTLPATPATTDELTLRQLSNMIAQQREIPTFTWSEAIHTADEPAMNQKMVDFPNHEYVDSSISCMPVDLSNFMIVKTEFGLAAVAAKDIPKGTFLCYYSGQYQQLPPAGVDLIGEYGLRIKHDMKIHVDARHIGGVGALFQHLPRFSDTAQTQVDPDVATENLAIFPFYYRGFYYHACYASADIKAGEMLGFDYGGSYWSHRDFSFFTKNGVPCSKERNAQLKELLKLKDKIEMENSEKPFCHIDILCSPKRASDLIQYINKSEWKRAFILLIEMPKEVLTHVLTDSELERVYFYAKELICEYASKSDLEIAKMSNSLGGHGDREPTPEKINLISRLRANPNAAIYHLDTVLKERLPAIFKITNSFNISVSTFSDQLSQQGLTSYTQKRYSDAIEKWKLCLKICKHNNDTKGMIKLYWNIGNAYALQAMTLPKPEADLVMAKGIKKLTKGKSRSCEFFKNNAKTDGVRSEALFDERIKSYTLSQRKIFF